MKHGQLTSVTGQATGLFRCGDLVIKEVMLFTAAIISLYDIQPVGNGKWKLPKRDNAFGVKRPTTSTKVWIKSRPPSAKTS